MSEVIWRDRAVEPPPLTELAGIPLKDYTLDRVWSVDGKARIKYKMPVRTSHAAREARHFVGRRPPGPEYLQGQEDDKLQMEHPYILSDDAASLIELVEVTCPEFRGKAEHLLRETMVIITIGRGWATPLGGYNSREIYPSPGITRSEMLPPWSWLFNKDDFDRLIEEDLYALSSALGYDPPIDPP